MTASRSVGVVTSSRADYSIYVPVLRAIQGEPSLELRLYVTGSHLSDRYGMTVDQIVADGFKITHRVQCIQGRDDPEDVSCAIAAVVSGFTQVFSNSPPDLLLVLGDRYEMFASAMAAVPFNIPIAHVAGGEITEGAFDNALRHAITKLSHLHFVSAEPYRRRVLQMGEESWRVHTTGNPSLDHLRTMKFLSREELERVLGIPLAPPPVVVTFHPVTLEQDQENRQAAELVAVLSTMELPIVITGTNADTHGSEIREALEEFARARKNVVMVPNLGPERYFSLLKIAACMAGNSSSGICEAASFELPVVNIGNRQGGRLAARNVIQVECERKAITAALKRALEPGFRAGLKGIANPYGDARAAGRIVEVLKSAPMRERLLWKKFVDLPVARAAGEPEL